MKRCIAAIGAWMLGAMFLAGLVSGGVPGFSQTVPATVAPATAAAAQGDKAELAAYLGALDKRVTITSVKVDGDRCTVSLAASMSSLGGFLQGLGETDRLIREESMTITSREAGKDLLDVEIQLTVGVSAKGGAPLLYFLADLTGLFPRAGGTIWVTSLSMDANHTDCRMVGESTTEGFATKLRDDMESSTTFKEPKVAVAYVESTRRWKFGLMFKYQREEK